VVSGAWQAWVPGGREAGRSPSPGASHPLGCFAAAAALAGTGVLMTPPLYAHVHTQVSGMIQMGKLDEGTCKVRHNHCHNQIKSALHLLWKKMGEDATEEAQRYRMDEMSDRAKVLVLSDVLERTVEEQFFLMRRLENKLTTMGISYNFVTGSSFGMATLEYTTYREEMSDVELLEKEVIICWSEKISKKHVSKEPTKDLVKSAPSTKWLKEVEEETSGSEEVMTMRILSGCREKVRDLVVADGAWAASARSGPLISMT
ncbi:hypothetical protein J0S82_009120, partial [Galemys pyrenaicus]